MFAPVLASPPVPSLLLTGLAVASQSEGRPPEVEEWGRTRENIQQLLNRYQAPSVSVAVLREGDIAFAQAFGLRDIEAVRTATPQTQYGVGSIVKTFTSGLMGALEYEGLVELDEHPANYVEGLAFPTPDLSANLRLTHLLSQTSGLPFLDGSLAFFPGRDQADLVPRLSYFKASCRVGDCWAYNNLNFVLLDIVAESVTGLSKSELLTDWLLDPAGMTGSLSSTSAFEASEHAATGYAQANGQMIPVATEYLYGEQVYATATDLARWAGLWMESGGDVLPRDYVGRAISMQAIENGAAPTEDEPGTYLFGYGYGWQIKSVSGHYLVHHGGNENGFSAQVLFVPASKVAFATLTNQQNSILPYIVNDLLLREALQLPEQSIDDYPFSVRSAMPPIELEDAPLDINPSRPPSRDPESLAGSYQAEGYGEVTVRWKGGVLELETPAAKFILVHKAGDTFGLASTQALPLGINMEFFELVFGGDQLRINLAPEPVVFSRSE